MKWRACTAVVVLLFATALHIAAGPAQPDSDGQTATRAFEPDENMVQAETGAGRVLPVDERPERGGLPCG